MKADGIYLAHILDSIERIQQYYAHCDSESGISTMAFDAIFRNLEIIGEATKKLSQSLKNAHPDIEWRKIAGLRDVLIHEYFDVDENEIRNIVKYDLALLRQRVIELIDLSRND